MAVDLAVDGREALALAQAGPYDLVLMDMQMPHMDGLEATRAIRLLPGWADIPILALTANAFAADRRACQAAGMNDFIAKPMNMTALHQTLLKWLSGRPSRSAVKTPWESKLFSAACRPTGPETARCRLPLPRARPLNRQPRRFRCGNRPAAYGL